LKAVVISESGLKLREVDRPLVGESSLLIKVAAAGICGTDLAIASRGLKTPLPLIMGHEFAGVVTEVGRSVNGIGVGTRVTSEINLTCGHCHFCEAGVPTHCLKRRAIGIDVDGAFAEYVCVPVRNVHVLPRSLSHEEGAFVEPLAAALQTFKTTAVSPHDIVVVMGDGRLGQLITQVAKALVPDCKLLMIGKHDSKLRIAERLGAVDITINATKEDAAEKVRNQTAGIGADVVIEATGASNTVNLALDLVRHRGTIALKSTHGELGTVDLTQIAVRELTLQGSRCGPFGEAIRMLNDGRVRVAPLISARYPLEKAEEAFECAKEPETLKVVFALTERNT
jgi:threonine dehydrogenase-like Zn-dependent dehydrogenase